MIHTFSIRNPSGYYLGFVWTWWTVMFWSEMSKCFKWECTRASSYFKESNPIYGERGKVTPGVCFHFLRLRFEVGCKRFMSIKKGRTLIRLHYLPKGPWLIKAHLNFMSNHPSITLQHTQITRFNYNKYLLNYTKYNSCEVIKAHGAEKTTMKLFWYWFTYVFVVLPFN